MTVIRVSVVCRERRFTVCASPSQSVKWLAFVAARRYARFHRAYHASTFVPRSVRVGRRVLMPAESLRSCMDAATDESEDAQEKQEDREDRQLVVHVELDGPLLKEAGESAAPEMTLWQRYAFVPERDWSDVRIEVDPKDVGSGGRPRLRAAFTGWEPYEMKLDAATGRYYLVHSLPPGTEVLFDFVLGDGCTALSSAYGKVSLDGRRKLNYLLVKQQWPSYLDLQADVDVPEAVLDSVRSQREQPAAQEGRAEADNGGEVVIGSPRLVGAFEAVRSVTTKMRNKRFDEDLEKMQFADIVQRREDRLKVHKVLKEHYDELRTVFQFFSSHGSGQLLHMSVMEYLNFCRACELADGRRIRIEDLDAIFNRVNVEEEFDEDYIEAHPDDVHHAMRLVPDPFNPSNAFIRGEFMEALVRIALRIYPNREAWDALETLMAKKIIPLGVNAALDDIRSQLVDPSVQRVYRRYARKLHALFFETAQLDRCDTGHSKTVSFVEFEALLDSHNLLDERLSRRAATQAFVMSQDSAFAEREGPHQVETYEMVMSEFLEALGRVAHARWDREGLSMAERVSMLLRVLFDRAIPHMTQQEQDERRHEEHGDDGEEEQQKNK